MTDPQNASGSINADTADGGEQAVKKGGLIVLGVIVLSLLCYLTADRYTPMTSQARVEGYVIGVAPEVSGRITEVWVSNNQEVNAGDKLFQMDASQYEIALNKANSDLENARRQVGAGGATVDAARANLLAAQANERKARQDAERLQRLYTEDSGTISVRRLEIAQATLEQSSAAVTAANADIQRTIQQMGGDEIDSNTILKTALTAVSKAELDLSNTLVKSPSRGVVTDLQADVGQYARAGSSVLTLIPIHDVWISAALTENNLGHLTVSTPVELLFDSMPGEVFDGQIRSIGLGVSAGYEAAPGALPSIKNDRDWLRQAQRFPVIVSFDTEQDERLAAQLRIGGQVTVIAYSEESGLLRWLGKLYIRFCSLMSYAY
ncbi:HlyD family secretion protein [Oceanicoccus sp. KOV_DT_Chl]|uniref:HlyD family secretion protein n=1 Tax=Oceanicoccus sp. KOV_DT_Chl TaxID=1904639 RepID=UPI001F4825C3|nr:HlyD family secretion protein [Oceanicoccus sp. KOV_DT_Chl]